MHLDHCNILPTWFPAPSLCCPLCTDAMLHIQDHTACQWWCWNSNLNLSYLRNKSTRKEKGLKLIFTTVFPMWTTTLSPFSCCFLTIINPRQTDQWHSLEWHTLSFLYTSAWLFAPLACHLLCPVLQSTATRTELSEHNVMVHHIPWYGSDFSWSYIAARQESIFPKPPSPIPNAVAGE